MTQCSDRHRSTLALALALCLAALAALPALAAAPGLDYPETPKVEQVDLYHGVEIADRLAFLVHVLEGKEDGGIGPAVLEGENARSTDMTSEEETQR